MLFYQAVNRGQIPVNCNGELAAGLRFGGDYTLKTSGGMGSAT